MAEQIATTLFTEKCTSYAKYRAGYPDEAIAQILQPYYDQETIRVIDVGAGTGIASQLMANQGATVIAIEPNLAMMKSADSHPAITYLQASAERTPIEDNYADVVTSFQAFHWFDFKKSLQEFNRILKPTGQLALVWNYWDGNHEFTQQYTNLIAEFANRNTAHVSPYEKFSGKVKQWRIRALWKLRTMPYFKQVKRFRYTYYQELDLEGLIGLARSQSYILHSGPEWELLCDRITNLAGRMGLHQLAYDINVFLAKPKK